MFAMILANIAGSMYGMYLGIYLVEIGATVAQVGLVFTIVGFAALIFQIVGGWVSDVIGRLNAIAIGSIGGVIGYFFLVWAPTWQWMIFAIILSNFPRALIGPSFGAFIAENSDEENRGQVYGITETIFQITGVVGPPLGGYLMGLYDFKTMILVAAVIYTLAAGLRIWMAKSSNGKAKENGEQVKSKDLTMSSFKGSTKNMLKMIFGGSVITWIFLTDGVRDIAFRLSSELQPLYMEQIGGLTVGQIGILGSVFSIAMMFTPILSGKMADKFGERVPITLGFSFISVAFAIFLNASSYFGFMLTWVVVGIAVGLMSPAYQTYISKVVPKNMLGMFNGIFYGSIGLISLPAPYIGSYLWEKYTPQTPFIVTAIVVTIAVIPVWFIFKPIKGKVDLGIDLDEQEVIEK